MNIRNSLRFVSIISILLLGTLSAAHFATIFSGISPLLDIRPAKGSFEVGVPVLGIDCGLGSAEATDTDFDGIKDSGDGTLDTTCTWVEDIDGDGIKDPLVSDPTSIGTGGGFTAEVRATDLPANTNGFDITLSYDTTNLECIKIDQAGLPFEGSFELARVCGAGTIRLAQVLLGATVIGDITFFRIRFDVLGKSLDPLVISPSVITNPAPVTHKVQNANFDSRTGLGWNISWTVSPNPPVPGQEATYTATASCTGCDGALKYSWDFDSDGVEDATGNPVTITAPPPVVNRVQLTVTDQVGNSNIAVRRLPLNVAITGPSTLAVNTPGTWTGLWNGGTPSYTGAWRFCPGAGVTANAVCHKPAPAILAAAGADQIDAQTLNQLTAPTGAYHFGGTYTDTLRITDGTATSMTVAFLVTVTGTPLAYTVTISNPAKANAGDTVTVSATMTYAATYLPISFRSSSFDVTFDWGDASSTIVSVSGCSTAEPPAVPCTASSSHVYTVDGTYTIGATAKETAPAAVSKIQELGTSTITINPPPMFDYSLSVSPDSGKVTVGGSTSATVTATLVGPPTETVTLSAMGQPTGTTITFTPPSGSPTFMSTMDIETSASTPTGPHMITIAGTSTTGLIRTTTFTLTVNPPPPAFDYSLSVDPTSDKVVRSSGTSATVTATLVSGTTENVQLSASGQPAGVAVTFDPTGGSPGFMSTMTITTSASTPTGQHMITITGTSTSGLIRTTTFTLTVNPPPAFDFTVTVAPNSGKVTAGGQLTADVTAAVVSGTPETVSFSASGAPAGTTVEFMPASGTPPFTSIMTITTSTSTPKGEYTITITGTSTTGLEKTTIFTLTVNPVALVVTVACPDSGLSAGKEFTCDVTATGGSPPYTGTGSQTASFAVKGTYTVTFTVTDTNGVSASGSDTVIIDPQQLVVTVDCPNSGLTAGKPFGCTVSASGGTGPYSGTGAISQSFAVKGTYTVTATVTDANGASASGSDTVVIDPQPLMVNVSCPDVGLSAGKPFNCDVSATGGTAPYTGTGSIEVSFAAKGTYTVTLSVTDANGATASGSDTVNIAPQPLVVTANCPDSGLTAGKPFTCTVSASGGTAPYTGTGDQTVSFAVKGTYTVTLDVTDANGVTASGSDTVMIAAQALVITSVTVTPTQPVAGSSASFEAAITGGTAPYVVSWDLTGDNVVDLTGNPVTFTYDVAQTVTIRVTTTDSNNEPSPEFTMSVTVVATATAQSATGAGPVTFTSSSGALPELTAVAENTLPSDGNKPTDVSFPFGFFSFRVTNIPSGSTITMTIDYPSDVPSDATYWKVINGVWTDVSSLLGDNDGDDILTLTIMDGGLGDADGLVNGEISDPGGVAVPMRIPLTVNFAPTKTIVGNTSFVALIEGGRAPFACSWSFGDSTPEAIGCRVFHVYSLAGTFPATLTVTDDAGTVESRTNSVTVEESPTLIRGKISWKHHISWDMVQRFIFKMRNPSQFSVEVTVTVDVFEAGAFVTQLSRTTVMAPGATILDFTIEWDLPDVAAKYDLTGTLSYMYSFGDLDGDGMLEMVEGVDSSKSGSFAVVAPRA